MVAPGSFGQNKLPAWVPWTGGVVALLLIAGAVPLLVHAMVSADASGSPAPSASPSPVVGSPGSSPTPAPSDSPSASPSPSPEETTPALAPVDLPAIVKPLAAGSSGPDVVAYQQRLTALSYLVGPANGSFGSATGYGVTAFQKVEGLPRTGVIDAQTRLTMLTATVPTATYTALPDHIEVDIARQVLFVVNGGRVSATVAVSTGTDRKFVEEGHTHRAVTPNGIYMVQWKYNGWWTSPLGHLYKPAFIDNTLGIAIHGYPDVPAQPASHGCIRVPMPFADWMYAKATPVGLTVVIHGGPDGPNP